MLSPRLPCNWLLQLHCKMLQGLRQVVLVPLRVSQAPLGSQSLFRRTYQSSFLISDPGLCSPSTPQRCKRALRLRSSGIDSGVGGTPGSSSPPTPQRFDGRCVYAAQASIRVLGDCCGWMSPGWRQRPALGTIQCERGHAAGTEITRSFDPSKNDILLTCISDVLNVLLAQHLIGTLHGVRLAVNYGGPCTCVSATCGSYSLR